MMIELKPDRTFYLRHQASGHVSKAMTKISGNQNRGNSLYWHSLLVAPVELYAEFGLDEAAWEKHGGLMLGVVGKDSECPEEPSRTVITSIQQRLKAVPGAVMLKSAPDAERPDTDFYVIGNVPAALAELYYNANTGLLAPQYTADGLYRAVIHHFNMTGLRAPEMPAWPLAPSRPLITPSEKPTPAEQLDLFS